MILLDTSFIIDLFKNPEGIERYFDLLDREGVCLSTVSYFEIFRMRRYMGKKEFLYFSQLFSVYPVYSFNLLAAEKASEIWVKLEKLGEKVNVLDVMIAGIMIANGINRIFTKDIDFQKISKITDIEANIV